MHIAQATMTTDCVWICQVARICQPTTEMVVCVSPAQMPHRMLHNRDHQHYN